MSDMKHVYPPVASSGAQQHALRAPSPGSCASSKASRGRGCHCESARSYNTQEVMSEWSGEQERVYIPRRELQRGAAFSTGDELDDVNLIDEKGQCYMRSCSAGPSAIEFFSNDKTSGMMSEKCTQPL